MMKKGGGVVVIMWLMVIMAGMLTCGSWRAPVLHRVGGSKSNGWREHFNYTEWSIHEHFYVGDWLYFGFNKHLYSVLEVNKTGYEQCDDINFIKNITKGGRDVFNLTEAKHYYFLSSGGYCWHGMKLEVRVLDYVPAPQPSAKSGSSLPAGIKPSSLNLLTIALAISLVWAATSVINI